MNSEIYEALGIEINPFPPGACKDFYFQTEATKRILDELVYGIAARKGFLVVVGEVGLGKTSMLLQLLPLLERESIRSSWVFNTLLNKTDLLQAIVKDYGIKAPEAANLAELLDTLHRFFLEEHKDGNNCAIILDEAHLLDFQAMEVLRMLSNLELSGEKLVQILLTGQPELRTNLDQPQMRQFRSRINVYHELPPLTREETGNYVNFKLSMTGAEFKLDGSALSLIRQASGGNFRRINLLMEKTLYAMVARSERRITHNAVTDALKEVATWDKDLARRLRRIAFRRAAFWGGASTITILLLAGGLVLWAPWKSPPRQAAAPVADEQGLATTPTPAPRAEPQRTMAPPPEAEAEPEPQPEAESASAHELQPSQSSAINATAEHPVAESANAAAPDQSPPGPTLELQEAVRKFLAPWSLEELTPALYKSLEANAPEPFLSALAEAVTSSPKPDIVFLETLPAKENVRFTAFPWQLYSDFGPVWIALWRSPLSLEGYAMEFRSPEVVKLQERLDLLGYYRLGIDGTVGPGTWKALESFQSDHGLKSTGKPDPTTLFWLYNTAMHARPPQSRPAPTAGQTSPQDPPPPDQDKEEVSFGIE